MKLQHQTLGEIIKALEAIDGDKYMAESYEPHSYRGYYHRLGLAPNGGSATVGETLAMLNGCVGKSFEGYKGGTFKMGLHTLVHVAGWGRTGSAVYAVLDGEFNVGFLMGPEL